MEPISFLRERDVEIRRGISLKKRSAVRIGGEARISLFPKTPEQAVFVFRTLLQSGMAFRVFGRMTNVCPSDDLYNVPIVFLDRLNIIGVVENGIEAQAGCLLSSFCNRYRTAPELCGIPGSIGGSIRQNAGAYGKEIGDILISALIYSPEKDKIMQIKNDEMKFAYRRSRIADKKEIVLSAIFQPGKTEDFDERKMRCIKLRREKQPIGMPSIGSTFMKVGSYSAAYWIDRCGLKGMAIGGAAVSEKHAGFIVNTGNASAKDYRCLTELVARNVYDKFSVRLKPEVEFL